MPSVLQTLVLGTAGLLAAVWIAGCSTSTDGSDAVLEAGPDGGADTKAAEGSVDGTSPDTGTSGDGADVGLDVYEDVVPGDEVEMGDVVSVETGPGCTPQNCGGTCCGDTCITALSCAGCAEGAFFCPYSLTVPESNGKCVSSCSGCDTLQTVVCYACGTGNTPAACAGSLADCPATKDEGACACNSVASCPATTQVCAGADDAGDGVCLSCGQAGSDGLVCANGGTCNQAMSACQ